MKVDAPDEDRPRFALKGPWLAGCFLVRKPRGPVYWPLSARSRRVLPVREAGAARRLVYA
jgi:hypothetical protein